MKKNKKPPQNGFTLIETMITMSLFFVILFSVYVMIQHYGEVSKTEHSRLKLQQESRYMVSSFSDEIKEAGAVLTLSHTSAFLKADPFFNGIYPLNSSYYPDGVILATGDPEAVSKLTADFSAGDTVITVENAAVSAYDASFPYENPQWTAGQKGIIIGTTGYLVFEVASVSITPEVDVPDTITIRDTPVYYSGLLSTGSYYDDAQGNPAGNSITYSINSPVVRLSDFSIYVFRDIGHPKLSENGSPQTIRQMIRISDAYGQSDPLANGSGAEFSVISENIWDMQISYIAYTDFATANRFTTIDPTHHYFAGGNTSYDSSALLTDIRSRMLKQVDITIIAIADELGGEGTNSAAGDIPPIGDNSYHNLPNRKLSFRLFSFSIEPRNYNIAL
jgi:prepilin-type N-terminal cleavage/methylation domain-containing protein